MADAERAAAISTEPTRAPSPVTSIRRIAGALKPWSSDPICTSAKPAVLERVAGKAAAGEAATADQKGGVQDGGETRLGAGHGGFPR